MFMILYKILVFIYETFSNKNNPYASKYPKVYFVPKWIRDRYGLITVILILLLLYKIISLGTQLIDLKRELYRCTNIYQQY